MTVNLLNNVNFNKNILCKCSYRIIVASNIYCNGKTHLYSQPPTLEKKLHALLKKHEQGLVMTLEQLEDLQQTLFKRNLRILSHLLNKMENFIFCVVKIEMQLRKHQASQYLAGFQICTEIWGILKKNRLEKLVSRAYVCVCVCVCVFTSIHRESFICLDQVGYQGTYQRCYIEDVEFLRRFPLLPLQNGEPNLPTSRFILFTHLKRAGPRLNQCTSRFQNMGPSVTISRRPFQYALHREPICFQT